MCQSGKMMRNIAKGVDFEAIDKLHYKFVQSAPLDSLFSLNQLQRDGHSQSFTG
jgi:hypothetical protein